MYHLHVLKNGQALVWTYDPQENIFRDENGNDLLAEYLPYKKEFLEIKPFAGEENPHQYGKDLDLLEIILGMNCNFNCAYCSQKSFRHLVKSGSPSDVGAFIARLKEAGIKPKAVQLWGGEPLVYWKTVTELVPELRRLYGDNVDISFPTNGSLLTRDKIDFIAKYHLRFWISHDGPHNEAREVEEHPDILKNLIVLDALHYGYTILPPHTFSFKTTLTQGNVNQEKVIEFFKRKVSPKANTSTNNVVTCNDSTSLEAIESSHLSEKDRRELTANTFDLLNRETVPDFSMREIKNSLIESFINHTPASKIVGECSLGIGSTLAIDMQGNILRCHNFGKPEGNCQNIQNLNEARPYGHTHFSRRDTDCSNCIVLHCCKGGCTGLDNASHALSCPNWYAMYFGVFRAAVASLFGVYLDRVEKL